MGFWAPTITLEFWVPTIKVVSWALILGPNYYIEGPSQKTMSLAWGRKSLAKWPPAAVKVVIRHREILLH